MKRRDMTWYTLLSGYYNKGINISFVDAVDNWYDYLLNKPLRRQEVRTICKAKVCQCRRRPFISLLAQFTSAISIA